MTQAQPLAQLSLLPLPEAESRFPCQSPVDTAYHVTRMKTSVMAALPAPAS